MIPFLLELKGPDNDFGIKFNVNNGGPAPESVTNLIYENTKKCNKYYICDMPEVNLLLNLN